MKPILPNKYYLLKFVLYSERFNNLLKSKDFFPADDVTLTILLSQEDICYLNNVSELGRCT